MVTGVLEENCYVLKQENVSLIVDPGDDFLKIEKEVGTSKVVGILITHSHFDHIGALRNFLKRNVEVFKKSNLEDGKTYSVGPFHFQALFTPGHSSDSVSFYFQDEKVLFTGDFIFRNSVGRVDLPTGSEKEMQESIQKIKKMKENLKIYPGHGDVTTLEYEKKNNFYFEEGKEE